MSFLDLAKFFQTQSIKNDELKGDIEELEDEIKKNLQLQQKELIHLEEKYHNLMKTHILDIIEKRDEKHKQDETLKQQLVDPKDSTDFQSHPKHDMQILKGLQEKKNEMYETLNKRSVVEKMKRGVNSKAEASTKRSSSMTRQNLRQERNDAVLGLYEGVQKLDDVGRMMLGNIEEEPIKIGMLQRTKEKRSVNNSKRNYPKTCLSFNSFIPNDLQNFDINSDGTLQKFNVKLQPLNSQKESIKFPLCKTEDSLILDRQKLDKPRTTIRRVHFKVPDNSFETPSSLTHNFDVLHEDPLNPVEEECSNIQDKRKWDATEITSSYQGSSDLPKNRSYTIVSKIENDLKIGKKYDEQQVTTSGILKSSVISSTAHNSMEKFKKKKKLLFTKEPEFYNYNKKESILSESIINEKIYAYNNFVDGEQDETNCKKNNWNHNSDSDTSSTTDQSLCCKKFFCHK